MDVAVHEEALRFENEVRRIARQLWPSAEYSGARIEDDRERDGIFETDECIHLLEATISNAKDKALKDVGKLVALASKKRAAGKPVQCWFVTKNEPTPEQRGVAEKHRGAVRALSFHQFQSKLIDASGYLSARHEYAFGSVRDPETGRGEPRIDYVPLDMIQEQSRKSWSLSQLIGHVAGGSRAILLGDYGAGKSMTLREVYRALKKSYHKGGSHRFPIYLNLRDHQGQGDPVEVLERHARQIGFPNPSHLVRAWRAGYGVVILDGFDELAALGMQGAWRKLRDVRLRAMRAIREFVRNTPEGSGLILSGRAHYFDSERERREALALDSSFVTLTLNEFTDEQITEYFRRSGQSGAVPAWLPSRPLLVGYLASRGVLAAALTAGPSESLPDIGEGWDSLIGRVCSREAEIEAGIDGGTVRRLLERLATRARHTSEGLGPLTQEDLLLLFKEVCGYPPDEQSLVLLQRLPGLGSVAAEEQSRAFIDTDFADACRAGDVVAFVSNPFDDRHEDFEEAECVLGEVGIAVAVAQFEHMNTPHAKVGVAAKRLHDHGHSGVLAADLVSVADAMGVPLELPVYVSSVLIPAMSFSGETVGLGEVRYDGCYFGRLLVEGEVRNDQLPRFRGCLVAAVDGRTSRRDLPAGVFDDECVFEEFGGATTTTNSILELPLPLGVRVLLTVLRKIFIQRGAGRKESSLMRGLDHKARRLVPDVLALMESERLVMPYRKKDCTIWLPNRQAHSRVGRIVAAPSACNDLLVTKAALLD